MKVALLISGGVDSSVALKILKDQGHDVTAFYLKIWLQDEFSFLGNCPWEEDVEYVTKVCSQLGVPFNIVPMQNEYWDKVVSYTIREVESGRTPNPDIFCNAFIKFGLFYDKIDHSYERIATGHYAARAEINGRYALKLTPDSVKDQTYFLSYLSQDQLKRAMFPLGDADKKEVRRIAAEANLPTKDKKDSQGICFLGQIKFKDFLKQHLGTRPGDLVDIETGRVMGKHEGYYFFTIGQRQGIGLNKGPWYVVAKDAANNIIYISNNKDLVEKDKDHFYITNFNWFLNRFPDNRNLRVKIRHGARSYKCTSEQLADDYGIIQLETTDYGIAPGQYAVFYQDNICLGAAMIAEPRVTL